MFVIAVAVIIAIPASLHTDLVCIVGFEVHCVDRPILPNVCGVAVPTLSDVVHFIDV
jgi:hypothetical protein